MRKLNRMAIKEWAVVVRALAEGSQIVMLRKGGIAEQDGEFRLAAREFFLYPTWEHQQEAWLQPGYAAALRSIEPPPAGELPMQHYAVVTDIWPAPELFRMKQLTNEFVWNEAFLEKRYDYRPELPLSVLIVRVYRLPTPLRLDALDRYAGCRSWVELEEDLSTEGLMPVLEDAAFEQRRESLREQLTSTSQARPVQAMR